MVSAGTANSAPTTSPLHEDASAAARQALWVILPALNEAEALPKVLCALPAVGEAIVVDNGSTDGSGEVARRCGARVAVEPVRGYGSACLRGISFIRDSIASGSPPPKAIAFLDADFSDSPECIDLLAQPVLDGRADLVIGSRIRGSRQPGAIPVHSLWGTRIACWLLRNRLGIPCTDLGPFRVIRWSSLDAMGMQDRGYGWTIEMQVRAARQGLRIIEIPVPYRRRIGKSKISGTFFGTLGASAKILWMLARHVLFSRPCPPAPKISEENRPIG